MNGSGSSQRRFSDYSRSCGIYFGSRKLGLATKKQPPFPFRRSRSGWQGFTTIEDALKARVSVLDEIPTGRANRIEVVQAK